MFIEPTLNLKVLAEQILKLSDFFIDRPDDQTPWSENYCKQAYRHYYLPLNFLRAELVIRRGIEVGFFKNIDTTIDWGAGPGTASFALAKNLNLKNQILIEKSKDALKAFQDLEPLLKNPNLTTELDLKRINSDAKKTMLVFSYSLTEMNALPDGWNQFEALMILEPATKQDGRKLLELRNKLMAEGYTIWAPCTHQQNCPLLEESKTDWCHDRVHVDAPKWFLQLEQHLPFKNKTITTSYLLARRTKPDFNFENKIRLTGDSLNEKGKTRQLACRGPAREFLTWMHKDIKAQTLPRGDLVTLHSDIEFKSNEIRLKKNV
jgi:ribosomal protein RSM22 (predicted rRNA methylase)